MCQDSVNFYQTGISNINNTIADTPLTDPILFHYFETLVRFEYLLNIELQPKKQTLFSTIKNLVYGKNL